MTISATDTVAATLNALDARMAALEASTGVSLPTLAFANAVTQAEGNSGTTVFSFTLNLTRNGSTAAIPFTWSVVGSGTNPANAADFLGNVLPSGSGSFAAGETSKTISINVAAESTVEPDEGFSLTAAASLPLVVAQAAGEITNDDAPVLAALTLSALSYPENIAPGTIVAAINGGEAGSTVTLISDAGGRIAKSSANLTAGLVNTDYEATPTVSVTLRQAKAGFADRDQVFSLSVADVAEAAPDVTAPSITSATALNQIENAAFSLTLTANEAVTFTKGATFDSTQFTLTGTTLTLPARNFEAPTDSDTNNSYVCALVATDTAGNATPFNVTVTITDADEVAPTITSGSAFSQAENSAFSTTLTASEPVTWVKAGGADAALFTLTGATLSMGARDYEAPGDADANNTYVVQVRATDTALNVSAIQTITVTVTDVAEGPYLPTLSTAPYMIHSHRRMVAGYNGNLFTLRRGSDNATLDCPPAAGSNFASHAAIVTFGTGTQLYVTAVYDQSGNGLHALQTSVGAQPAYDASTTYGGLRPFLIDSAQAINPATKALTVATMALERQSVSSFLTIAPEVSFNNNSHFEMGTAAIATRQFGLFNNSSAYGLTVNDGTTSRTSGKLIRSSRQTIGVTSGASAMTLYQHGVAYPYAAYTAQPMVAMTYGKSASGATYGGQDALFGGAHYPVELNATDAQAVIAAMDAMFSVPSSYTSRVIFDGDSIMQGSGATMLKSAPRQVGLSDAVETYVTAVHGQTLAQIVTARTTRFAPLYSAAFGAGKCVFIEEGGINDIRNGTTGSALYASATTLVTYLKGLGYTVGLCTLLPWNDGTYTTARDTERLAYNSAVMANAAGADFVIDRASDATIGGTAGPGGVADNTTYFLTDKIHMNNAGYAADAAMYRTALAARGIN